MCEYILREGSTFKKKKRTVDQKHLVSIGKGDVIGSPNMAIFIEERQMSLLPGEGITV